MAKFLNDAASQKQTHFMLMNLSRFGSAHGGMRDRTRVLHRIQELRWLPCSMRNLVKALVGVVGMTLSVMYFGCRYAGGGGSKARFQMAPTFTADKLIIQRQLRAKDFAQLDTEFDEFQKAFEADPKAELNENLAFDSFASDDPVIGDLAAQWTIKSPNSFAAHMAVAAYFSWRGWHTRGPAPASETADDKFAKMRTFFSQSEPEAQAALKLRPKLSVAYVVLLSQALGPANRTRASGLRAAALKELPASFLIRAEIMEGLLPRWGGDHESMSEFAQQSQNYLPRNPYLHWLLGFVDMDEGETLGLHSHLNDSIAAFDRAIISGGDFWRFYMGRGVGYAYLGSYPEALAAFDTANRLSPQDPELLIRRAWVLGKLERPRAVLADLKVVALFEAPDETSTGLQEWADDALKKPSH